MEDYFALVAFSSDVVTWRPSLQKATEENVKEAKAFVHTLRPNGCKYQHNLLTSGFCFLYVELVKKYMLIVRVIILHPEYKIAMISKE